MLNNLLEPQSAANADYDVIYSKLSDYLVPTVLEVAESFRFHCVVQRDGESIVSCVSRFREAASKCNYGALLSRSLRDQFVSGVAVVENQRELLEVERDFEACIKIALYVEVASKELVSFKSSSAGVNFVKHNKPKINLIVLKNIGVKDRINFLMFVAIAIKRTILQRFASNLFGKKNPNMINLLVITYENG